MTTINRNDLARNYLGMRQEKDTKDICWYYNHKYNGIATMTEGILHFQMKE